jgi:hypothetical protein
MICLDAFAHTQRYVLHNLAKLLSAEHAAKIVETIDKASRIGHLHESGVAVNHEYKADLLKAHHGLTDVIGISYTCVLIRVFEAWQVHYREILIGVLKNVRKDCA